MLRSPLYSISTSECNERVEKIIQSDKQCALFVYRLFSSRATKCEKTEKRPEDAITSNDDVITRMKRNCKTSHHQNAIKVEKFLRSYSVLKEMKNDQLAESYSVKADEFLSAKQYAEALENYNQCLRFAPGKSKLLSDAYAGRAKVFDKVQLYQKCLENIQFALDTNSCEDKCISLKKFHEECRVKINNIASETDSETFIKLLQPPNKKIPFISDCLEVRENDVYGRYIMTTSDLQTGDTMVFEEPFYKVVDYKQRHVRCAVCLKQNTLNLFPCAKCSDGESVIDFVNYQKKNTIVFSRALFLAMFCSKKCSDSVVHRYECSAPKEESFDKLLLQRMFYQAIEITGSLEELQKLMNRQMSTKTIMDFDLSDPTDPMKDKKRILATTSLAEREPWSAEAYAKYESVTQQLKTETESERNFLRQYLVRCLKSMTVNFFHFFWSPTQTEGQGFALCSLAAYFAHSCDPNVEKIDVDNKFAFVARRPIKAGEQLFMNYDRYSFLTHSKAIRQDYFNKIYTFECACSACKNDYPLLSELPQFDKNFVLPEIKSGDLESSKQQFKENRDYIEENMKHYPCYEICSLMIQNNHLLHAIGNELPF